MNYVGLDVHKRTISFCVRSPDGRILQEGSVPALREALDELLSEVPAPCLVGLEATLFTAWVYDHFTAKGISVKVAHPAMLKAIFAGKRKNDEIDARKLADLLRCNYFPECHIASREIRDRRRVLRYRNVLKGDRHRFSLGGRAQYLCDLWLVAVSEDMIERCYKGDTAARRNLVDPISQNNSGIKTD